MNYYIEAQHFNSNQVKMTKTHFPFGGMVDKDMQADMGPDALNVPGGHLAFFDVFNHAVLRNEMKWYHNEWNEGRMKI